MNPSNVIIRFDKVAEQAAGSVQRIIGFVRARELIPLFNAADLDANPRSAKSGQVTSDILDTIVDSPESFVFMTKGILVGASSYERLQRNRYRLFFENTKIEGILDGGHNALAIGTHILKCIYGDAVQRKVRTWPDFKSVWDDSQDEIDELKKLKPDDDGYDEASLDFLVPIEILVPSDLEDEDAVDEFNSSLLAICSARNNNVQLTLETKANKKGFYEDLRKALPAEISERVEWKTNDGGEIKARDLIALTWIPLTLLGEDLDYIPEIAPQNIYRNKGECAKSFDKLLSMDEVSSPTDGEYTRALHNEAVMSALQIGAELPELYDKIYREFPLSYNETGGKFGRLSIVKMADDMRTKPTTYFTKQSVDYRYPDGLIMPLVYGLQELMEVNDEGCVQWKQDPYEFLEDRLTNIVKKYRVILEAFRFDPQKVGKNEGSYDLVLDAFQTELMLQNMEE